MEWLKNLFKGKPKTLKISILTLFLSLTIFSFLVVMSLTYYRSSESIYKFAVKEVEEVSSVVLERLRHLVVDAEQLTRVSAALFAKPQDISLQNRELIAYMLRVVKYDEYIANFYVGREDGDFLGVFNRSFSKKTHLISDKRIPEEAALWIRFIKRSQGQTFEKWIFINEDLDIIETDSVAGETFDPRNRPWYIEAKKSKTLNWSDIYKYDAIGESGVSVSYPIFDQNKEIEAIVGADLSFQLLSDFISEQKIGKSGKIFILDQKGNIIVPKGKEEKASLAAISQGIVDESLKEFREKKERDFVLHHPENDYLVSINIPPIKFAKDWSIVTIVPLNDFFADMLKAKREILLTSFAILLLSGILVFFFSKRISAPIEILSREVDKVTNLDFNEPTRIKSNIREIFHMDKSIAAMRIAMQSFSRYVPKEVVTQLIQKGETIALGGEKKEVTIFFSDIADFSSITETHTAEKLMPLLAEYFDEMSKIILDTQGTIDKFIGDSIMAFWGAPLEIADHATRACLAALRCHIHLEAFNGKLKAQGMPEFKTRFGIHAGIVIVGNIGTEERMNYTIIGDPVNTASRLQQVDKFYHTSIIISEQVYKEIGDKFVVRPLDIVSVKGKKKKIKIYELIAVREGESEILAKPAEMELADQFTKAYEAFERKDLKEAKHLFEILHQKFPDDHPTQIFLDRLA